MHLLLMAVLIHIVKPGEYLSGIVGNRWPVVCQENHIRNCDLIYPGQRIVINKTANSGEWDDPARYTTRHRSNYTPRISAHIPSHIPSPSGTLSCYGLERLWESAGGNSGSAFIAAEIAMAESGGRQYATGPAGERGYWQIHPVNGYLSTYNAFGNAKAAIILSGNGRNWSPWTTYTSGIYRGRCL